MGKVTIYIRDDNGNVTETKERMANLARPPATTVEDFRKAIVGAVNVLGSPNEVCAESMCEGCNAERSIAIRDLLDTLDYETWEEFYKKEVESGD